MWKLVIEDDEGKRTVVHLTRDRYTVGRKEGNSIRLTERNISREHAVLLKRTDETGQHVGYSLEDVESYNGVFVNGLRTAKSQDLVHGDLIQLGDYRVVIQDDALENQQAPLQQDPEDLKATLAPGRVRARGTMLLERPNRLVMLVGPTPGAEYPLDRELITIGRAEDANVSVNHNSVSRMHCEVHKLAEGRYEIVDNGSSNGVRVNGSDLSRGIIEAGDIIELGDVRFRFVAAGQVFLANASDSQQLAAITDRQADQVLGTPRKSGSIVPFVALGLLLGGAAVAAVYFATRPSEASQSGQIVGVATVTLTDAERTALADARRLAVTNPEAAHKKMLEDIPPGSAGRTATEFAEIESRWAAHVFAQAERMRDPQEAIALLREVAEAPTVSETERATARDLIQARLAQGQNAVPSSSGDTPLGVPLGSTQGQSTPQVAPKPSPTPAASPAQAATPKTTTGSTKTNNSASNANAGGTRAERAKALIRSQDYSGARALLYPAVASGTATNEEATLLYRICRMNQDQKCQELAKRAGAQGG